MSAKVDFNKMRAFIFFGLIIFLGIVVLYIIRYFAYPIFWAAVVAVMFRPFYTWLERYLRLPSISSATTLIVVIITIFLPLGLLSILVVSESANLYQKISGGDFFGSVEHITLQLEDVPFLGSAVDVIKAGWPKYAVSAAQTVSVFMFKQVTAITQNSIRFIFMSFIMLYTLFFFLKDGPKMLQRIMHLSPLGDKYEGLLYERFTSTARATLKSTLILGSIQGALGGILFWITGVEGALIWAIVMTFVAMIPALGSFLVWLPIGLIMLALGNFWQGLTILIVGAVLISNIDNLLRPMLVGRDTQMHPLFVLFSTLGGIFLFGISGFVLGPVIMSLFLSVISIYDNYYRSELGRN
ncbi:MAG: hypothetical protein A3J66_00200 [Candidatus Magasanikbacteria bacterium RIFCSPHIGHO2_02_FULL_47_14]|uniref:AI-2E family transporter n=1 Tax=Candidatus Magasanikbacteria bacterium RIFCSPHIGHO2_02_FULL_47_14 TaxID=1798680 RepID=A0A1F6MA46_9BACT|nr:MAG: hypothetical protein A3J66_00200 [Candidatus Magasanikbacteria bacterium RIFCSPHIGHO2_02_FULL_47_14]